MNLFKSILSAACLVLLTAMGPDSPADNNKKPFSPFEVEMLEKTKAPEFVLKNMAGQDVSLASSRGKVILLNFWATWCPACVAEMSSLNRLYRELKSRGFEIIAVSTDRSSQDVKQYLMKRPLEFSVVIDENRSVTKQYKVFSLPTTFLIDREGIINEKFFGEYDWTDQETRKKIEKLL